MYILPISAGTLALLWLGFLTCSYTHYVIPYCYQKNEVDPHLLEICSWYSIKEKKPVAQDSDQYDAIFIEVIGKS